MSFISSLLSNLNYGTILFLMLLESTVVPVRVCSHPCRLPRRQRTTWFMVGHPLCNDRCRPWCFYQLCSGLLCRTSRHLPFCQQQVGQDVSAESGEGREKRALFRQSRYRGNTDRTPHSWHPSPHQHPCRRMACYLGWTGLVSAYHRTRGATQRQDFWICWIYQTIHHRRCHHRYRMVHCQSDVKEKEWLKIWLN